MHEQHKHMIENLRSNQLFKEQDQSPQGPARELPKKASVTKSLDDLILDYLEAKEERQK